jgi:hypothetical protein
MNRNRLFLSGLFIVILFVLNSCSDSGDDPDPCLSPPEISVDNVTVSVAGKSNGEITVSATDGTSPYMFSIDGTNFQSSGTFSNLAADDYTIIVKDAIECTDTEMATVEEVPEVFYANQIRPIIDTNCQVSNCHGSRSGIPTYATYTDVKAKADRIKFRTGEGTMPPNGPLASADVKLIADWVDQGAPDN